MSRPHWLMTCVLLQSVAVPSLALHQEGMPVRGENGSKAVRVVQNGKSSAEVDPVRRAPRAFLGVADVNSPIQHPEDGLKRKANASIPAPAPKPKPKHQSSTPAPTADTDDVVMVFSGKVMTGMEGAAYEKAGLPQGVRLEWLKPLRCNGNKCSECAPMGGGEACPYPNASVDKRLYDNYDYGTSWYLNTFSSDYDNYRLKLHVQCKAARSGHIKVRVVSGAVDTMLDGNSIVPVVYSAGSGLESSGRAWHHFHFDLQGGSHEVEIKFKPNSNSLLDGKRFPPEFLVGGFTLHATSGFVTCAEKRYCLHDIIGNSSSSSIHDVYDLVGSNDKQLRCLENTFTDSTCTRWKDCLAALSNTEVVTRELRRVMQAALRPQASRAASQLLATPSAEKAIKAAACIDPRYENPEEWACDCHADWLTKCPPGTSDTDIDSACLQQYWCDTYATQLCTDWKDTFCTSRSSLLASSPSDASPVPLLERVDEPSPVSLLERLGHRSDSAREGKQQGRDLDESLTGKELC